MKYENMEKDDFGWEEDFLFVRKGSKISWYSKRIIYEVHYDNETKILIIHFDEL